VIDFPPPFSWMRGSLGVPAQVVSDEIRRAGFEPLKLLQD